MAVRRIRLVENVEREGLARHWLCQGHLHEEGVVLEVLERLISEQKLRLFRGELRQHGLVNLVQLKDIGQRANDRLLTARVHLDANVEPVELVGLTTNGETVERLALADLVHPRQIMMEVEEQRDRTGCIERLETR